MDQKISLGDIFRKYGEDYIQAYNPGAQEKGLIRLLSLCRTSGLGTHHEKCNHCGHSQIAYNSCRNRHCPLCQQKDKEQWLEKRMEELLPVGYYHLVFTIPEQLNALCLQNKKVMYDILFKAASQTVLELASDNKHLGASVGLTTVLHSWGQNMLEHPHLHCIMPAGGLDANKSTWIKARSDFFIHVKVVSRKFRGKFLDLTKQAYMKGELQCKGAINGLNEKTSFARFTDKLYKMEWVVNIQPPFANPQKVLEYLSRYVFRIAITERRIIGLEDSKVVFRLKDYRTGLYRTMKLDVFEFIRRFLLHSLPKAFLKVRYYGIFANRYKKENIAAIKNILEQDKQLQDTEDLEDGRLVWQKQDTIWNEIFLMIKKYKKANCPCCGIGRMMFAGLIPAMSPG
jgi:hypothetical protein